MQSCVYWQGFFQLNNMQFHQQRPVPEQKTGAQSNTEVEKKCSTEEEAHLLYTKAAKRLLTPNLWHRVAGTGGAQFYLTDSTGNEVDRAPQKGDHFKIDVPGPGPATGDGFDWVRIEEIIKEDGADAQRITIRVRPATNPTNNKHDVAHFFSEEATSNFVVERTGTVVKAAVHGRNEAPNTSAEALLDKARNTAVATGAISGFAKLQWSNLVNGFLAD